jgi:hypothetical protein
MAAVSGMADSFELQQFGGELFALTPTDHPTLSLIGGIGGSVPSPGKRFTWMTWNNNNPSQPANVEGGAPTYEERDRSEVVNVTQIYKYGIHLTYDAEASHEFGPFAADRAWSVIGNSGPVGEMDFQIRAKLARMARDINYTCLNGVFANPTSNSSARTSRGLRAAITTNVETNFINLTNGNTVTFDEAGGAADDLWTATGGAHGLVGGDEVEFTAVGTGAGGYAIDTNYWIVSPVQAATTFRLAATKGGTAIEGTGDSAGTWTLKKKAALAQSDVDGIVRTVVDTGAQEASVANMVFICSSYNKQQISSIYGYAPQSRTVGGLNIQQVETDFGPIMVLFDRDIKKSDVYVVDAGKLRMRHLVYPGRGVVFTEPQPAEGDEDKMMLMGTFGLEYGPEAAHGKITGLTTVP